MVNNKGQIPWNRGKRLPDKMRKNISLGKTGTRLAQEHKEHIAISQKKRLSEIKQCSACPTKSNRWIFKILIPVVHATIPLDLCEQCLIDQFFALSPEDKRKVEILQ